MTIEKVLLVEGQDDEQVIIHLLLHHKLKTDASFKVKDCKGYEQVRKTFPTWIAASDIRVVGVLVDANDKIQGRWDSFKNCLEGKGYPPLPGKPPEQGFIAEPPSETLLPRVGIWLMPDNSSTGAIENFLRNLVPKSNGLLEHAQNSIDSIPRCHRLFKDKEQQKALLRTWLAWQEKPGKPFGTAIKAGYLNGSSPLAEKFINWFGKLFAVKEQ